MALLLPEQVVMALALLLLLLLAHLAPLVARLAALAAAASGARTTRARRDVARGAHGLVRLAPGVPVRCAELLD